MNASFLALAGYREIPFPVDLAQKISVPRDPLVLDINSPLGQAFINAGVTPKGDEKLFPALTPDCVVVMLTYRLRAMITKNPDTYLPGWGVYRDMVEFPGMYPRFWKEMGHGPLLNWGTASVPTSGRALLLGEKKDDAVTYANKWGPPAGIFEIPTGKSDLTLQDALIFSAGRELSEETGVYFPDLGEKVSRITLAWDAPRCKPQAFVKFEFELDELKKMRDAVPTEKEFKSWQIVQLSSEGLIAAMLAF
ncbi:MAG: hypothetical protein UU64_C0002G0033 [candidate division WWE3 bacterium GW2011_GWF2_41_45]|uniref:Nudix hydrolase domain-containing protein n=3 Tax=Katanobacteria TaxID=422282 RepID=A0A1F4W395_UNCKA|nr:MAG: hypothetical protein UU55_C0001G0085 [candidate division WWE3 bacterium GW2011_GWC2_41_23]KKS10631.1 MAG: hypothetical protein UU64_C0002G0033 [candidate division WWE3 bacterium GW2011_GWF2_41_45]KKS12357.1 MAG: hypothetical protein UU68_C0002G0083 [candidate division WWE3 bacterium GW2011_GWF1_41_53]KKS20432.1 MAG: hypothetical protein UU79_C0001G0086 [candidate division WWE3 bacterium GW2011_GWE1_41_72]KKS28590.1 MAG: hypothetical protein UU90_C0023G0026 [candidate division WWE3 bacte